MTAIILVAPQMGENIGAAARVMANFGFTDLRIVNPRDGWPNEKAIDMAAHAAAIVENAKVFEEFSEAVADLEYLYALTARERGMDKNVITPREVVLKQKTGFVFGAERTGLDNEDISICDEIISIPVNPEHKSINLAQSVAIITYELSLRAQRSNLLEIATSPAAPRNDRETATKEDMNSLFEHLEEELAKRGFFQEENKRPGMMNNIRTLFTRAALSPQESRTMRGIIRSLSEHRPK